MNPLKVLRKGWTRVLSMFCYAFDSGLKWWAHILSWVTYNSLDKIAGIIYIASRKYLEILSWVIFWSSVNNRSTHLAEVFDIPKMSDRIDCTAPKLMPNSLALLRMSRLFLHTTKMCTTLTFTSAVASLGRPDVSMISFPLINSTARLFTVL